MPQQQSYCGAGSKEIDDYVLFKQVQFDVPGGKMIADQVLVKYNALGKIEDVVVLENKLKSATDYTIRQKSGWGSIFKYKKLKIRSSNSRSVANYQNTVRSLEQGMDIPISKVIRLDGAHTGSLDNLQSSFVDLSKY